jgi:hypothetical protein
VHKLKGCVLAAIKKRKTRRVNGLKKRGQRQAKPDIVIDAILLRSPRSAEPFPQASPRFPKEKENFKRERSCAADKDRKDKK